MIASNDEETGAMTRNSTKGWMPGRQQALCIAATLLLASTSAVASVKNDVQCNVDSDYDLSITPKSLILTRDTGTPKQIVMRSGRLFVDDRWVKLSAEDSARIAEYEKQARATMPLAQAIGRDAADIAFTTLGEVARGLSASPEQTQAHLAKARAKIDQRLARSVTANRFNGNDLGHGIADAIGEALPIVIGDIVGGAIGAAFSGDTARIERLNSIDKEVERRVEPRSKLLEARAMQLCRRMEALDQIDDSLAYRLPDGSRLDLLDTKVDAREANAH
jgi:hypothetical protein